MVLKKLSSSFLRLIGSTAPVDGVLFEGSYWKNSVDYGSVYPRTFEDLIRFYPLALKVVEKEVGKLGDNVAVSIPAENFLKDIKTGEKVISRIKNEIEKENKKEAIVLPQGASAIAEIISNVHLEPATTLIIDGGFNTINVVVVNENNKVVYARSYYNEFGIRNLLERYFRPLVEQVLPTVSLNHQVLKKAFLQGYMPNGFDYVSLENERDLAVKSFVPEVMDAIKNDLTIHGIDFEQFVIVGGLSYYIPASSIQTKKKFYIPEKEGEFLTVKGMNKISGLNSIDFGFGDIKILIQQ
jgi:hypothetical protein